MYLSIKTYNDIKRNEIYKLLKPLKEIFCKFVLNEILKFPLLIKPLFEQTMKSKISKTKCINSSILMSLKDN